LAGLALLFCVVAQAEFLLPESNYVFIEDKQQPERSRLLVMSDTDYKTRPFTEAHEQTGNDEQRAIVMATSANSMDRVRGLTLLAGNDGFAALETALVLMADQDSRVREEALQILFEHPKADRQLVVQLGSKDKSARIRQVTEELLEEAAGD
jgi:hypothetical protein